MSSLKLPLIFSALAEQDIDSITAYTLGRWGETQAKKYQGLIVDACKRLCEAPLSGRPHEGCRRYAIGKHVIYYKAEASHLTILRILHEKMDASLHLH